MSKQENQPETTTVANKDDLFADTNISMKSGHLVKDVELVKDGQYAKFRIASNEQYPNSKSGEIQTKTYYFNVLVSANLTDAFAIASNLKKGDWVYFKGKDQSRSIDTVEGYKDTGVTTFAYKVVLKKAKADSTNGMVEPSENETAHQPA